MYKWDQGLLSDSVRQFVDVHLGEAELVDDMSWGQVDTKVLHVRAGGEDFVVKSAGLQNHHIGREITAHESFTAALVSLDRTGRLIAADRSLNVLITTYQPGSLVEGTTHELDPAIHTQAGVALRALHDQHTRVDNDYEQNATKRSFAWLDRPHQIAPHIEAEARRRLAAYVPLPVVLVPTHGDWQPRNWLVHNGRLRVIDFGRFDFRPAATDLCRLEVQQWAQSAELESAFIDGYGRDPRDENLWMIDLLREAIGTAVWAYQVKDDAFESQGHRMLSTALERFE